MGGGAETPRDPGACGVTPPACVAVENHLGETDASLIASVGCVVERPLACLVSCRVLCCRRPGLGFPDAGLGQRVTGKSQTGPGPLREGSTQWRDGQGWHAEEVRRCLGRAGGLPFFLWVGARFLSRFAEDVDHRVVSAVTVPGARTDCGVIAEALGRTRNTAWPRKGIPVKGREGGCGSAHWPSSRLRWCCSREIQSPCVACSISASRV